MGRVSIALLRVSLAFEEPTKLSPLLASITGASGANSSASQGGAVAAKQPDPLDG